MAKSELVPFCLVMNRQYTKARPLAAENFLSESGVQAGSFGKEGLERALQAIESEAQDCEGNAAQADCLRTLALVDNARSFLLERESPEACTRACASSPDCIGSQYMPRGRGLWPCTFRIRFKNSGDTCLASCRALFQSQGFKDIPMVPVEDSDGEVYMRDDCMDENAALHNNTYYGIPWDWEQPGLSLARRDGYGASPLLDLVTTGVLDDTIAPATPPWSGPKRFHAGVDLICSREDSRRPEVWLGIIDRLRTARSAGGERALVVDLGKCICPMLSNGWNPRLELRTDVVLLMHRDQNYSPASPHTNVGASASYGTSRPCVKYRGNTSVFSTDVEAFTSLAQNPHVLGMYFMQTPPITHEKVFLVPLGVDTKEWVPSLRLQLKKGSPRNELSRTALYEVSHNLAIPYRRDVFRVVQENFAPEPLRVRHLMWAFGQRMGGIVEECMQAVFSQSPIGVGENCFRHGEVLLAGSIPVVQASIGVASLRYLPHLAVSNWREVTPEMLSSSYQAIWDKVRAGHYSFQPLTNQFWHKHIDDIARRRPIDPFYAKFPNPPVTCASWNCTSPR